MLGAVASLGVLMLLLLTGMETDLRLVRRVGRPAVTVSLAGIAVPFASGVLLGEVAPDWILPDPSHRLLTSLFLGTALSIASVKIVAMVVRELGFLRRDVGQIILASAILDDTLGWILIAVISGIAVEGAVDLGSVGGSVLGTVAFLLISLTAGRRIVSWLIRWTNDNFVSEMPVISAILAIMGVMALITDWIGVHTVLGAFIAGVLVGELPILTKHIDEELRGLITALFMPVFFCLSGLGANLTVLADPWLLLFTVAIVLVASVGKFAGAFLGGWLGGLSGRERLALAAGMNARGSTEVIIATIGLSIGALNQNIYTMIVTMAVVTTLAMPPMLRWALLRLPLEPEEKARLDREAFAAKGFVPNLERLLLAVDNSPNGRLASYLAGLVAGTRGMPTTVLEWQSAGSRRAAQAGGDADAGGVVKAAAETARTSETSGGDGPAKADVTTRAPKTTIEEAVASELAKGYGLLFVGVEGVGVGDVPASAEVGRVATAFEGPLALVHAGGRHREEDPGEPLRILVPVSGTAVSRRAAEVAFALARATSGRATALYVSAGQPPPNGRGRRIGHALRSLVQSEEAILREVVEVGERYDAVVRTAVGWGEPDAAIIRRAQNGRHDLIVMGVNRRPGEGLSFGKVADAVLENGKRSVLFVTE